MHNVRGIPQRDTTWYTTHAALSEDVCGCLGCPHDTTTGRAIVL